MSDNLSQKLDLLPCATDAARIGDRFGRLTVLDVGKRSRKNRKPVAVCQCSCGSSPLIIRLDALTCANKPTQSCGCIRLEASTVHGHWRHPLYQKWRNMMRRCTDPSSPRFPQYGGRGIKVCSRWRDIRLFIADLDPIYAPGMEIDRIDVNGDYEPGNVRFVSHAEQAGNRTTQRYLTHRGRTMTAAEWSRATGINYGTILDRCRRGWSDERVIATPAGPNGVKRR